MDLRKGKPKWRGGPNTCSPNKTKQNLSMNIRKIQYAIEQIEKADSAYQKEHIGELTELYMVRRDLQDIYFKMT